MIHLSPRQLAAALLLWALSLAVTAAAAYFSGKDTST